VEDLVARLAVHRLTFLSSAEKARLTRALAEGCGLGTLGFSGLERIVGRLLRARAWRPETLLRSAESDAAFLARSGVRYVGIEEGEYPPLLREIHDPPYGLFARGGRLRNGTPSVAIVGTRRASGRGVATAAALARDLARAGLPVVSGLARGIDAAAHRGALAARDLDASSAPTLAVLPTGIDAVYPPSHRGLASAILERGGCLLSEYPPGEVAATWHFPERNRIIAGLARGTLVVEAPESSGALITSSQALEEGRDVFVAAATLGGPRNAGCDRLASEGALALASYRDLLVEWEIEGEFEAVEGLDPTGPLDREHGREEARDLAAALRAELGLDSTRGRPGS